MKQNGSRSIYLHMCETPWSKVERVQLIPGNRGLWTLWAKWLGFPVGQPKRRVSRVMFMKADLSHWMSGLEVSPSWARVGGDVLS